MKERGAMMPSRHTPDGEVFNRQVARRGKKIVYRRRIKRLRVCVSMAWGGEEATSETVR